MASRRTGPPRGRGSPPACSKRFTGQKALEPGSSSFLPISTSWYRRHARARPRKIELTSVGKFIQRARAGSTLAPDALDSPEVPRKPVDGDNLAVAGSSGC